MFTECNFIIYGGKHHEGGFLDLRVLDYQQNYQKPYATKFGLD
jgi:hypothetical protein